MRYCFSFITLQQYYLCATSRTTNYQQCTQEQMSDICLGDTSINYKVDQSYQYYFDNWYVEMDLFCKAPVQIAMLASVYSFGYLISGFLFWVPDRLGRKRTVILSLTIAMTAETIMVFNPSYSVRMICFFITGLFQLQNSVSYVWLYESVSK